MVQRKELCDRLRRAEAQGASGYIGELCHEAATEIELLRETLRRARVRLETYAADYPYSQAEALADIDRALEDHPKGG